MANEIIYERKHCPWCDSYERVGQQECEYLAERGQLPKGTNVGTKQEMHAIFAFTALSVPMVPAVIKTYDLCRACGREYITIVQRTLVPRASLGIQDIPK